MPGLSVTSSSSVPVVAEGVALQHVHVRRLRLGDPFDAVGRRQHHDFDQRVGDAQPQLIGAFVA